MMNFIKSFITPLPETLDDCLQALATIPEDTKIKNLNRREYKVLMKAVNLFFKLPQVEPIPAWQLFRGTDFYRYHSHPPLKYNYSPEFTIKEVLELIKRQGP